MRDIIVNVIVYVFQMVNKKPKEHNISLVYYYYYKLNYKNRKRYFDIQKQREKLSIFDYKELSEEIPVFSEEFYYSNSRYNHAEYFKKFAKILDGKPINAIIEHGIYNLNAFNKYELKDHKFPTIITFGPKRREFLQKHFPDRNIYSIGPYIHYVEEYLKQSEFHEIKKQLGRVMLVFPTHSIDTHSVSFDYDLWLKEIENRGKNFDTILICLYYKDIQLGSYEKYLNLRNCKIVTAGHKDDRSFLNRIKTIIQLSDMTMSNSFSTSVSYCLYLSKPHYYYVQNYEYSDSNNKKVTSSFKKGNVHDKSEWNFKEAFTNYKEEITTEQKKYYTEVAGGNELKTSKELYKIIGHS
jgi:hypothetical protein